MTKYYEKKITEFDLNPDFSLKHEINSIETGSEVDFTDFINFFDKNKDKKTKKAKASLDIKFKNGSLHQGILEDEVKVVSSFGELKLPLDKEINTIEGLSLSKLFDYSSNSSN